MTYEQFRAWRKHMGYSQRKAAEALGITKNSVFNYEHGKRSDRLEVVIPRPVELACAALALGVTRYGGPDA